MAGANNHLFSLQPGEECVKKWSWGSRMDMMGEVREHFLLLTFGLYNEILYREMIPVRMMMEIIT